MAGALRHAKLSYGRNLRPHRCFRNCGCHVAAWEWRICSGSLLPTPAKRDHTGNGPYNLGGSPQLSKLVRTGQTLRPQPNCLLATSTARMHALWHDLAGSLRLRRREVSSWCNDGILFRRISRCQIRCLHAHAEWKQWHHKHTVATSAVTYETASNANIHKRPVLYVHGFTFPSALSVFLKLDGRSWADDIDSAGFSLWGLDFASLGGSERYPEMATDTPPPVPPLGAADDATGQVLRAVTYILEQTGTPRVAIIAHSRGCIVAGLFATQYPDLVDRLVFFGPGGAGY